MICKCFKCEKEMESACGPAWNGRWEMPNGGVQFEGGWNFGSSLYDAMMDGIYVEIVICDECLRTALPGMKREMRKVVTPTKSIPATI